MTSSAATAWILALLASGAVWAEPDEEALGKSQGYPVARGVAASAQMPYRVGSWSATHESVMADYRRRVVPAGGTVTPLPPAAVPPPIRYRFRNLSYTLDEYLERQRVTGLLILQNGQVVAERYRYARAESARFVSFSMAKSVTALLVGMALERGAIATLDDPAQKYARDLEGSPYGATTLRQLLRMSSGLTFSERYDGQDDVARLTRAMQAGPPSVLDVLRGVTDRHSPAGQKFTYASAETLVLGRVLAGATGRPLADLTSEWLWKPMGAEHDAFWRIAPDGQEGAHGFFHASLRDWGRLGWLLAQDGKLDGRQLISAAYLLEATDAARQPAAFQPGRAHPFWGYGYQFWLFPMKSRSFAMQGVYGQAVFVQPSSGIVMVQTAVYAQPSGGQDPAPAQERNALWRGVLQSLGGSID